MNHPGPKSFLQRIVKKALPIARFRVGQNSPERHTPDVHKPISYKAHDVTPKGSRTPYHTSHWHVVVPERHSSVDCGSHEKRNSHDDALRKPPQPHHSCTSALSIQTHRHSVDASPNEVFNLDNFIRKNESWAPPSPREDLSRRQFREARQASNMKPRTAVNQSSGNYLIHRPMKG
ncbi:hypothetical protein B0J17DRAFT_765227 [Rhizoctonia solani]|nr:hypothetical protein B0J17DRAFT_765227 [Rhizoctonia solani]